MVRAGLIADQTAFFLRTSAKIITVKKGAFGACRSAHKVFFSENPASVEGRVPDEPFNT